MTFGKYELLEKIGKGSIADVFKAKSFGAEGFEKILVVKRISDEFSRDEKFAERFVSDTQHAVLLNHANIVQVFDVGKVDDVYFLAMELVQGQSLAQTIRECRLTGRQIPVEVASFIAAEIAKGLDFAHKKRGRDLKPLHIVHRDLSAYNILLSVEGEVKIADFGLSEAKQLTLDRIDEAIQSRPLYIAPEQAMGAASDKRADIFCLGLLLYEMITLNNPLKGLRTSEVADRMQAFDTARIFEERSDDALTPELIEIIETAMQPVPEDRFQDAGEVYEALIANIYSSKTRVNAHTVSEFVATVLTEESSVSDFKTIERDNLQVAFQSSLMPDKAYKEARFTCASEEDQDYSGPQVIVQEDTDDAYDFAELRDIAFLAVHSYAGAYLRDNVEHFQEVVENAGGSVVLADENDVVIGFGLDLPCGRETEEAMDAAFKLRRIAAIPTAKKEVRLGICVWPAKVSFSERGSVLEDEIYFEAISRASEAASYAKNCVVTSVLGRDLSTNTYQFDEYPFGFPEENAEQLYQVSVRLFHASEAQGRLFGRHNELRAIGNAFTSASNGTGGYLILRGEPGIGKTRIVNEGQWRLLSSGGDVGWFEDTCLKWNSDAPFSSLAGIFRSMLALEEIEEEKQLLEKVGRLRELGLTPEELASVHALLGMESSPALEARDRDKTLFSAFVQTVSSLAADRMLVLIWEHAEYMDAESRGILADLAPHLTKLPILVILTHQSDDIPAWQADSRHRKLDIGPLSRSDATRLAVSRLDNAKLSPKVKNEIIKISGGNPLYLEEYVWALKTQIDVDQLPKTLNALLAYRISKLEASQKHLLERASVLGHRFNLKILGHLLSTDPPTLRPTLMELREAGLVTRVSANELTFATGVMRDTVYNGMEKSERAGIHRSVAKTLDALYRDRQSVVAARAARHLKESGDWEQAAVKMSLAGKNAKEHLSAPAALSLYSDALDILRNHPGGNPERTLAICVEVGQLSLDTNDYAKGLEKIRMVDTLSDKITDKSLLLEALLSIAMLNAHCEKRSQVKRVIDRAMKISNALDDPEMGYRVRTTAGHAYFLLGDVKRAAPYYEEALEFAPKETRRERRISCLAQLSKVEASAGELERAMQTLSEAERLADKNSPPEMRCKIEQSRGRAYFIAGNSEKAIECHKAALKIAKEHGLKPIIARSAYLIGELYLETSANAKAFTYLMTSKSAAEETGLGSLVKTIDLLLSYIDAVKYGTDDGVQKLEHALTNAQIREALWEQLHLFFYLSRIYIEKGRHEKARDYLSRLIELGGTVNNRLYHKKAEVLLREIDALSGIVP